MRLFYRMASQISSCNQPRTTFTPLRAADFRCLRAQAVETKERETGIEPATSSLGICPSFVYQRLPCSMRSQRAKEFSRNCKNDTISSLNGVNGVWNCCRRHPLYMSREPSRFPETGPRIRHGRKTTQAYEAAGDSASAKPRSASGDPYSSLGTGSTTSRDFLTKILVS